MPWIDFAAYPLWINVAVFALSAVIVWVAGSRLAVLAAVIADRTGLGEVFIGSILLAVATSLPEIGRTISASLLGNALIAVDSLLGGIIMQTAILALADLMVARLPLTYFAPRPSLILGGAWVVLLLGFALAGMAAGEITQFLNVGLWTAMLFGLYIFSLHALQTYEIKDKWRPVDVPEELKERELSRAGALATYDWATLTRIFLLFALSSVALFVAGAMTAEIGGALAVQTGLGGGFVGATLLAFASSLPEMTTTISAVRIGAYALAISNIFGTNAFLVALLFLADIFYRQAPILQAVDRSATFIAAAGIITTTVYLLGMIERRNRIILGMGIDSLVVLIIYALSLVVLFMLH